MTCRRAAALAALLGGAACAHAPRPAVARPAEALRCEEALAVVRDHPAPPPRADALRQVVTTPASWLLVGAGYTADVAAISVGTVAVGAMVCLPIFALDGALGGGGDLSAGCVEAVARGVVEEVPLPGLGRGAASVTGHWRCPDRSRRAAEARAVAACLAARAGPGDRDLARRLLAPLAEERTARCLPRSERARVERALRRLTEPVEPSEPSEPPNPAEPAEPL